MNLRDPDGLADEEGVDNREEEEKDGVLTTQVERESIGQRFLGFLWGRERWFLFEREQSSFLFCVRFIYL